MSPRGTSTAKKRTTAKKKRERASAGPSSSERPESERSGFYSYLRARVQKIAKDVGGKFGEDLGRYALLLPDLFVLITRCAFDKRVPVDFKKRIGLVVLYLVSPIDLFPEAVFGPVAFADDIVLAAYSLDLLVNRIDPQIIRDNWPGEGDVLDTVREIAAKADRLLGRGLWQKVKAAVDKIFA